jgi:hypothetical protein
MINPKKTNKNQSSSVKKANRPSDKPTNKLDASKKQTLQKEDVSTKKIDAEQLFAQALLRHKKEIFQDRKEQLKEMSNLALIAQEYLSSFALIGYSLQNERVVLFNMPSPKDEAALVDLLRATFIDIANNRP